MIFSGKSIEEVRMEKQKEQKHFEAIGHHAFSSSLACHCWEVAFDLVETAEAASKNHMARASLRLHQLHVCDDINLCHIHLFIHFLVLNLEHQSRTEEEA